MRIFLAGASGVIGVRLVPLLTEHGHVVAGMTRTPEKAPLLATLGAEPVVCDVFDAGALQRAVSRFGPDLVLHQLTDLPDDAAELPAKLDANARIRSEGTRNLLAAAGSARLVAQSVAWELPGPSGLAQEFLEGSVLAAGGTVLRYGQFYGPGTFHPHQAPPEPRVHIDRAASRTVAALDEPCGIVTITD